MRPSSLERRAMLAATAGAIFGMQGCGSLIPTLHPEAPAAGGADSSRLLLVGRFDVIPPIGPGEQKIRPGSFGLDPADIRGKLYQRAVLYLAASPSATREGSAHYINPRLGEWFGFWVPREHRHVTEAQIVMDFQPVITSRRHAHVNTSEILLPAPLSLDFQPQDAAVYIGTWRIWRDEFNSVTRIQAIQEAAEARTAAKRLAGREISVRLAIPRL